MCVVERQIGGILIKTDNSLQGLTESYSSCDQQLRAGLERTTGRSSHLLLVINADLLFQTMTKSAGSTLHQT